MNEKDLLRLQVEAMRKAIIAMAGEIPLRKHLGFKEAEAILNPHLLVGSVDPDSLTDNIEASDERNS